MAIEKYSIEWINNWQSKDYDFYDEVRELVYKRHKLIEPQCGCYGKRVYNKLKNKTAIKAYEQQIQIMISGTMDTF